MSNTFNMGDHSPCDVWCKNSWPNSLQKVEDDESMTHYEGMDVPSKESD